MREQIVIDTLQKLKDDGKTLSIYCDKYGCHNNKQLDLDWMIGRFGPDHSCMAKDVTPYFRCSKCGSDDLSVRIGNKPIEGDWVAFHAGSSVTPTSRPQTTHRRRSRKLNPVLF